MRVREWGRGGGGGHTREGKHPKEVVGGAQDLYCDRDHVVSDTWCPRVRHHVMAGVCARPVALVILAA